MTRIKYQGLTLPITKWSKRFGIPEATIRRRLNQGLPMEEVFARQPQGEKTLNFRGKIQTISAWAKELELTRETIEDRLARGLPLASVLRPLHPILPEPKGTVITFQGQRKNISQWARELGVQRTTIRRHLIPGTMELKPFVVRPKRDISYQGRTMSALRWAHEIGITPQAIYQRIARGLPVEEILAPKKQGGRPRKKPQP